MSRKGITQTTVPFPIGKTEGLLHLLCWALYAWFAYFGLGHYWDTVEKGNVVMTFLSFPLSFLANAWWFVPVCLSRKNWFAYGAVLLFFFLLLELTRTLWILADTPTRFSHVFLGPHEISIPVLLAYLLSFAYAAAKNWFGHMKVIETLKKEKLTAESALSKTQAHPYPSTLPERQKTEPKADSDFFFVNTGNSRTRIFYKDILYVQGEGNYVYYVTPSEKILVRRSIKEVLNTLPSSAFAQIHRSYIVALGSVEKIQDNHVFFAHDRIPISTSFREAFLQKIDALQA